MPSVNSIMSGGTTGSVYGNRNILSGLASGMDTESMIENAVSGHKMKISLLQQKRTIVEWQQSAYRSIIDKMVSFNQKYTSFSRGNNLMSQGFFDSAVNVVSQGENADKISASGRTDSEIKITGVSRLATNARYAVGVDNLAESNTASGAFQLDQKIVTGAVKGELKLGYGGKIVTLDFNDKDVFEGATPAERAESIAKAINKKLADQKITFDSGSQKNADQCIQAVAGADGSVTFQKAEGASSNNDVWIENVGGNVGDLFGISVDKSDNKDENAHKLKSFTVKEENISKMTHESGLIDALSEKGFTISLDGVTKTVKGPTREELEASKGTDGKTSWTAADYENLLQKKINDAFGTVKVKEGSTEVEKSKLQIHLTPDKTDGTKVRLSATAQSPDSKFAVKSELGKELGMENDLTSFVNLNNKLETLIPGGISQNWYIKMSDVKEADLEKVEDGIFKDKDGNFLIKDPNAQEGAPASFIKADKNGNALLDFKINGKSVGTLTKESTLRDVMNAINSSEDSGIKMAYSEFTNKFTFESKIGGADGKIEFGDGLAKAMFGANVIDGNQVKVDYEEGKNAKVFVSVNGEKRNIERNSNTFDIDGLKITLKGTFDKGINEVTFKNETDSDKIVNVVKDMVKDYNELSEALRKTYTTMPQQNSKGRNYLPLTDKDREGMSESEIKNYEEKAKQGILFGDRDLVSAYEGLRDALNVLSVRGNGAGDIGLNTSFSNGATTLTLDEEKLRKALEQNPDKVKDIFTRSMDNGSSSDGLMAGLKRQLDRFASTTGATKGLLIEKAGTPQAPTSIFQNELQKQLDSFDKQIVGWQAKLSDKIDYYNHKFTILEQMIAEMNNQSGMLMGAGGGY